MALGAAGQGVALFVALLALPTPLLRRILEESGPATGILIGAAVAIGVAGFLGLLAGLTAKPRPSGSAAAALYLVALTALLVGIALARSGVGVGAA